MYRKRKTKTDGIKREYWNSLFSELQDIHTRLRNWDFRSGKYSNQLDSHKKMEMMLMYHQVLSQKRYTQWFIGLTIANIFLILINLYLNLP